MKALILLSCVCVAWLLFYVIRNRIVIMRQKKEAELQAKEAMLQKQAEKKAKDELFEACQKGDIDTLFRLLESGINPNTIRPVPKDISFGDGCVFGDFKDYHEDTLLDLCSSDAAKRLLRAYGAKTMEEIKKERETIKQILEAEKRAKTERQKMLRQAQQKAKEEADLRKVDKLLEARCTQTSVVARCS